MLGTDRYGHPGKLKKDEITRRFQRVHSHLSSAQVGNGPITEKNVCVPCVSSSLVCGVCTPFWLRKAFSAVYNTLFCACSSYKTYRWVDTVNTGAFSCVAASTFLARRVQLPRSLVNGASVEVWVLHEAVHPFSLFPGSFTT